MKKTLIAMMAVGFLACSDGGSELPITYFEKGEEPLEIGNVLLL